MYSFALFLFSLCFLCGAEKNVISQISAAAAMPWLPLEPSKTNPFFLQVLFAVVFYYSNGKVINITSQIEHLYLFKKIKGKGRKVTFPRIHLQFYHNPPDFYL